MNKIEVPPLDDGSPDVSMEVYLRVVKPVIKPEDHGKYVAIDVVSEDFELDHDDDAAADRLLARRPDADIHMERVGHPAPYQFSLR